MTEKDLDEFEKEFGFKLLPTSFKKPLSEITKEEYRERIEYLWNAIINDDSKKGQELIMKKLRKKQDASLRKLKKAVQIKKEVDEFVKKLKEQEQ